MTATSNKKTLLFVFGTRPEAVKMAPLILACKKNQSFNTFVCSTGQHREMLQPLFQFFAITPDFDLKLMRPGQGSVDICAAVLVGLKKIQEQLKIDGIIVQGDTSSCFAASLFAFYEKIPLYHVEAGLRSHDMSSPFPEEFNRTATSLTAHAHFAPTLQAQKNLLAENVAPQKIFVTGNTGIDALFEVLKKFKNEPALQKELDHKFAFLNKSKKLILVTVHRQESFGQPLREILMGLAELAKNPQVEILIPVHLNPQVRQAVQEVLGHQAQWIGSNTSAHSIWLCEPQDYIPFIYLMNRAHFIITDSGGVQEEAPSLGKPILVARTKTERPEAIAAGNSLLIPLEKRAFVQQALEVLNNEKLYQQMAQAHNPFGDGKACERIIEILQKNHS